MLVFDLGMNNDGTGLVFALFFAARKPP